MCVIYKLNFIIGMFVRKTTYIHGVRYFLLLATQWFAVGLRTQIPGHYCSAAPLLKTLKNVMQLITAFSKKP